MNRLRETLKLFSGFYKRSINAGTWKSTITSHIQDVAFDSVTSQRQTQSKMAAPKSSIFCFSILKERKTLLFALIKVSTFICKREILGCKLVWSNLFTLEQVFFWEWSVAASWTCDLVSAILRLWCEAHLPMGNLSIIWKRSMLGTAIYISLSDLRFSDFA